MAEETSIPRSAAFVIAVAAEADACLRAGFDGVGWMALVGIDSHME